MKKLSSLILCLLLVSLLTVPALAAGDAPVITMQPQNYTYPEYSVAIFTVKATGTNLRATWYLAWNGATYNLSDNENGQEPWEAYAGESYGANKPDDNTFTFLSISSPRKRNAPKISRRRVRMSPTATRSSVS